VPVDTQNSINDEPSTPAGGLVFGGGSLSVACEFAEAPEVAFY